MDEGSKERERTFESVEVVGVSQTLDNIKLDGDDIEKGEDTLILTPKAQ